VRRDFNKWFSTFTDNIASWKHYTNFPKVYNNVEKIKVELNILNSLIGSRNIENEFIEILTKYPNTLEVIPILIAIREYEIKVKDDKYNYVFNFKSKNYSINEYVLFMRKTGLFDLLENHLVHSLVDYVIGVEVGMDTNSRKNRTGTAMEDIVENYLIKAGLIKGVDYFKEMKKSDIEKMFGLNLDKISNNGKVEKRFDFVIKKDEHIYALEVNFYTGGGSKLNETARSYKTLALESKGIENFTFVWFTDGVGWNSARNNLEETFDVLDTIYNIKDLEDGIIEELLISKVKTS